MNAPRNHAQRYAGLGKPSPLPRDFIGAPSGVAKIQGETFLFFPVIRTQAAEARG